MKATPPRYRVLLEVQVHEGHGQKAGAGDADHRPPFAGLVREDAAPQHDPHARGGEGHLAAREKDNVVEPVLRHEPFVDQHHGAARQQVREDREHERHAQRRAEDARALAVFVEPGARTHRLRRAQDDGSPSQRRRAAGCFSTALLRSGAAPPTSAFTVRPCFQQQGSCLARILANFEHIQVGDRAKCKARRLGPYLLSRR